VNIKTVEAEYSSKMLAFIYKTICCYNPKDKTSIFFSASSALRIRLSVFGSSEVILKPLIFRNAVGLLGQRISPE
jgi:hypothetical protein